MTWVRLDDEHQDHPKIDPLSDRAYRLWIRSIAHSNRFGLNGALTPTQLRQIRVPIRARSCHEAELIRSGLWHKTQAGVTIHDIADYQPKRQTPSNISAVRSAAGKKGADARWGADGKPDGNLPLAKNAPVPSPYREPSDLQQKLPTMSQVENEPKAESGRRKYDLSGAIEHVFGHYNTRLSRHRVAKGRRAPKPRSWGPHTKEYRWTRDRLTEDMSASDLCQSIDGMFLTPHNIGTDPRGNGREYLGLHIAVKSENVRRFMETVEDLGEQKTTPGRGWSEFSEEK